MQNELIAEEFILCQFIEPVKKTIKKCEHGKQKSQCKDCGGSGICEHGKRKAQCKDCGGSGICEHGKRKRICKDCGGSEICEHGTSYRKIKFNKLNFCQIIFIHSIYIIPYSHYLHHLYTLMTDLINNSLNYLLL